MQKKWKNHKLIVSQRHKLVLYLQLIILVKVWHVVRHYAVVEAPYPSKAACTSMWSTYKVFEPLHMQWMGICNHWQPLPLPLLSQILTVGWKLGSHCWATNHTIVQWLRLHTHPKLHAHQRGAQIRCMNQFICSGWAYGTISNPLPLPLLTQILKVGWHPPGSLLSYKPYHYAVVEARKS